MSDSLRIDNEIDFVSVPLATELNLWCNLQNTGFKLLLPPTPISNSYKKYKENPNRAEKCACNWGLT
jgi:hypothetical protein